MNTAALAELQDKWPDEYVSTGGGDASSMVTAMTQDDFFAKHVAVDSRAATAISGFAAQNQFAYEGLPAVFRSTAHVSGTPVWQKRMQATYGAVTSHRIAANIHGFAVSMELLYAGFGQGNVATTGLLRPTHGAHARGNAEIAYKAGVVRVKLPKLFPQIVLDSRNNDRRLVGSMDASIKSDQKLQLEGDFNDHFVLYAPLGLQVNVLTVLAPNFMQILKDSSCHFDVEFYGDEMVLLTRDPLYTERVMQVVSQALDAQLGYLQRLLSSWNYQPRVAPFDMLRVSNASVTSMRIGRFTLGPFTVMAIMAVVIAILIMLE